jgi:hypothetical protein
MLRSLVPNPGSVWTAIISIDIGGGREMSQTKTYEQPGRMTAERARLITGLFRAIHPSAATEIGNFVDGIIHALGDDVTDLDGPVRDARGPVSMQAAQAAVEFVMAAMLRASR